MRSEWPRGQRTTRNDDQVVCEVHFCLAAEEATALNAVGGREVLSPQQEIIVTKSYAGDYGFRFPESPDLFPNPLAPDAIASTCERLPKPTSSLGEEFFHAASECANQAERHIKEGVFDELTGLDARHKEEMEAHLVEDGSPLRPSQERFISDYSSHIARTASTLIDRLRQYERALEYIIEVLPTFIYMDDYKTFRGRASLELLRGRWNNQRSDLSEEDETFLMILRLSGLDPEKLLEQGESDDQDVLHDRQLDLQDGAQTLTRDVAGRWEQNQYEVQFRVDGQTFFTGIQETDKDIGMIPLEEQSKGFQWFFSFDLHFMHDSDGTFQGCVLLLDEPGLHLHPGGQADLLSRLDAYAEKNTLIYTTHLPFLVDLRDPKRIRVINQTQAGAVVSDDLSASQKDERLTLQAALGMQASQHYLVSSKNLLVEGASDYWIIAELSRILEREEHTCLPSDVMITAAGGASEIVPLATFMIGQELRVVALFDSDSAGKRAEEKLRMEWITSYKGTHAKTLLIGDAIPRKKSTVTIEDIFPEEYYLEVVRESHSEKLLSKDLGRDSISVDGSGPILPRLNQCFERIGVEFNKGSAAKRIRRDLIRSSKIDDLPNGLAERAEDLMTALRDAFGVTERQTI